MRRDTLRRFGDRVRELRRARGVAQEKMAVRAGLDRSYYGGVERGERNVSLKNIEKIAKALNCRIGELFEE